METQVVIGAWWAALANVIVVYPPKKSIWNITPQARKVGKWLEVFRWVRVNKPSTPYLVNI